MNPLILLVLTLIAIFSFFLYLSSLYKIYEPTHELFEHPGICGKTSTYCMDSKSFYFKDISSRFNYKSIEKELNEWLKVVNKNEKPLMEVKYVPEKTTFIAFAVENISKTDVVFTHSDKSVFHKLSMTDSNFVQTMNKTKLANDQYVLKKMNLTSVPNIIIMSLIYHIYHLEESNYKPWIMTFPSEISGFFPEMTQYEFNTFIKINKEMYPFVKDYFESLENEWKTIEYFVRKRMSSEERESFFNGNAFTKTDYIYARFLTERNGWSVGSGNDNKEIIMFPGNDFFVRKNIENESGYSNYFKQQDITPITNTTIHLKFLADRNFSKGDIIEQSFAEPRSFLSALIYGEMPKYSYLDCIVTDIFYFEDIFSKDEQTKSLLKWASESGTLCLSLNPYGVARLKIVASILNMNKEEVRQCIGVLQNSQTYEQQYNNFMAGCANPGWKMIDPRKLPLKSLNSSINFLNEYHEKAVNYLSSRKYNGKDSKNAELFVTYAEEKLKLAKKLVEKVKTLTLNREDDDLPEEETPKEFQKEESAKKTEV